MHSKCEKEILDYFETPKPNFPEEYWEAFLALPKPTTTTFRPFNKTLDKTKLGYIQNKSTKLVRILGLIWREKQEAEKL
jgi:hypothetical protein